MAKLSAISNAILRDVIDSMQRAEELGGPEGQDYRDLMAAIAQEANDRIARSCDAAYARSTETGRSQ